MNNEIEIKEMLAVARELMREWWRMRLFVQTCANEAQTPETQIKLFDEQFPKEAP